MPTPPARVSVRDIAGIPLVGEPVAKQPKIQVGDIVRELGALRIEGRVGKIVVVAAAKRFGMATVKGRFASSSGPKVHEAGRFVELEDLKEPSHRVTLELPEGAGGRYRVGDEVVVGPEPSETAAGLGGAGSPDLGGWGRGPGPAERVTAPLASLLQGLKFEPLSEPISLVHDLTIVALHCPRVPGCKAQFEREDKVKTSVDCAASFVGVGGGRGKQATFHDVQNLEATSTCIAASVKGHLIATYGNLWAGKKRIMSGLRVDVDKIDGDSIRFDPLPQGPSPQDPCGRPAGELDPKRFKSGSYDMRDVPPEQLKVAREIGSGGCRTDTLGVGLPFTILGVQLGLSISTRRVFSTSVSVRCELVGGKSYRWYQRVIGKGKVSYNTCWSVD